MQCGITFGRVQVKAFQNIERLNQRDSPEDGGGAL